MQTLTLPIGGSDRTLCFSQMGFMENVGEITDADPLEFLSRKRTGSKESFNYILMIVYAGLLTQCDIEDKKPDFDKEQVTRWVKAMSFEDGGKVLLAFTEAIKHLIGETPKDEAPGEQQAQTLEIPEGSAGQS